MKKALVLMTAILLVLATPVVASAEDMTADVETVAETVTEVETETAEEVTAETEAETAAEATEAHTEAEETEVEEETDEAVTEAQTETDELAGLLDVATPEQIEIIKQYIAYGVSALPASERVKLFLMDNLESLAWIVAAVAFAVFCIVNRLTAKKSDDNARKMTDNAIEIAEYGQKVAEAAREGMEQIKEEVYSRIASSEEKTDWLSKEAVEALGRIADQIVEKVEAVEQKADEAVIDSANKESGLTEAVIMFSEVVAYLVEHSHSLPEWERDKMTAIINDGKAKIGEVTTHEESHLE